MTTGLSAVIMIIAGIAVLLLVGFSIPVLLQLWRATRQLNMTIQTLNQSLPGILKNLEEITTHANRTTTTVHRQVEDFSLAFQKIQGMISRFAEYEEIFRTGVHASFVHKMRTYAAIVAGIRVFFREFMSKA